jgi:hypothetical protein
MAAPPLHIVHSLVELRRAMPLPPVRRTAIRVRLVALLLSLASCGTSSGGPSGAPALPDPSRTACGPAYAARVDGTCSAVGPAAPAPDAGAAFALAPDGWGYEALAGHACAGDQFAVLGQASCVPVDDCSAPFPPSDATFVVSQTITGANVMATLDQALSRTPPGGVVALDAGSYPSLSITSSVTLVGRCASTTTVGDGVHNAVYVNGPKVTLRSLTLSSASSPIAVALGSVHADRVILRNANVSIGVVGQGASVTLTSSLVVGLSADSLGGMAAQGGQLDVESSEIRAVTEGLLATDPGSKVEVRGSVVSVVDSATSSGLEASGHGTLQADGVLVRSTASRLAAAHGDAGTLGATPGPGTMTINASVLEQQGAELTDAPAVYMGSGSQLTMTDTTLRHQSLIGLMADSGKATFTRISVLGSTATNQLRTALYVGPGATADVNALAVPWAQGVGVMVDSGAQLALTGSLVANVVRRDQGEEAILVSGGQATVTACELANNQQNGIVAIGGATVSVESSLVHDSASADGSPFAGALILHSSAVFDGSFFARNGEGIDAAGSAVVATSTVFLSHHIALRAMDGMELLPGTSDLADGAIAYDGCQFVDDDSETSTDTLPDLNAPPFPDAGISGQ